MAREVECLTGDCTQDDAGKKRTLSVLRVAVRVMR